MKLIAFLLAFAFASSMPPQGFYGLSVHNLDGSVTQMSSLHGKKILITEFDASKPDHDFLATLDSLQASDSSLKVIAVPAIDFKGQLNNGQLKSLQSSVNVHYVVTEAGNVGKGAGASQLSLFKWLTDVSENTHFDADIISEKQIFLVSSKGELFAVLGKDTPVDLISELLKNAPN